MSTTTIGIDIDAPPELVYRLSRDVTSWDVLLPHYARSRPVERRTDGGVVVDFVARRPFVPAARARDPGDLAGQDVA